MSQAHFDSLPQRYKLRSVITPRRLSIPLTRHGRNYVTDCSLHESKTPTMFFSKLLGYWEYRCVQCGVGGDLIDYVGAMQFAHLEGDQARQAAFNYWIDTLSAGEMESLSENSEIPSWLQSGFFERTKVLDAFVQYCVWSLSSNVTAQEALQARGWSVNEARLYGLGYFNAEIDPFLDYCSLNGIDQSLVTFYLNQMDSIIKPCLTLPVRNAKDQIYTVLGIEIKDGQISDQTFTFSTVAGDVPFNIVSSIDNPIIVPTVFDALTADLMGVQGVVSLLGNSLNSAHLYKLQAGGAESITVVLNQNDDAFAQEEYIEKSLEVANSLNLVFKSIILPPGFTVESLLRSKGRTYFDNWLKSIAPDKSRLRRRAMLLQDVADNYESNREQSEADRNLQFRDFAQMNNCLGRVKPAYYMFWTDFTADKTLLLTSLAMDLLDNNSTKLIYVTYDAPRKKILNRLVALVGNLNIDEVQYRPANQDINQKVRQATQKIIDLVNANKLEIWDESHAPDDVSLLRLLRSEVKDTPNIFLCIDGFYRLNSKQYLHLGSSEAQASAALLDIHKALGVTMFCAGEAADLQKLNAEMLRDPDFVFDFSRAVQTTDTMQLSCLKSRGQRHHNFLNLVPNKMGSKLLEK